MAIRSYFSYFVVSSWWLGVDFGNLGFWLDDEFRKQMKNKRYVFQIAHQRSGSHFLGYCMGTHPDITYVDEITTIKSIKLLYEQLKTKEDVIKLLDDKFGDIKTPLVLVDIKYRHMMPALAEVMHNSKVIHLFRENKLDTYYSALHAQYRKNNKTGEYVDGGEITDIKEKLNDFPTFARDEDVVYLLIKNELNFRRKYGYLAGLTFSYEELTKNNFVKKLPTQAMKKICKFLEIEEHPMTAKTIKMSPTKVRYHMTPMGNQNEKN